MSINIGDNFSYLGKKFLDARESFETLELMNKCKDVPEGFVTYCKEDKQRYEYKNDKWVLYKVASNGTGGGDDVSHYEGIEEPNDTNVIWFDPSDDTDDEEISYENPVILELKAIIVALNDKIAELESRVAYLEINGGGSIGDNDYEDKLLLEDGTSFLLEDGTEIILEIGSGTSEETDKSNVLLEDGSDMLLEDNTNILLEN